MNYPKFTVTSSPHLRAEDDTRSIMLDVLLALVPVVFASAWVFGWRVCVLVAVTIAAAVLFEWAYRKLLHKPNAGIGDLSAAVTGALLALTLPVTIPLWMAVVGAFFAIVVVKQLFGGIGKNFMNPALAARAFLFSWATAMTTWVAPNAGGLSDFFSRTDAVTMATPLSYMHGGALPQNFSLLQAFIGDIPGSAGEVSAVALLLGGLYLLWRRVITWRIPVAFIGTVAIVSAIFPQGGASALEWSAWSVLSGGVMLGAIFMATDYVTSPVTPKAQLIYGAGCGLITLAIRYWGSYPEGVSYAILVMNACVWLLDKIKTPRFGAGK